jgi:predicted adenylyl cyclase CyaB
MKNIEVKARCPDLARVREAARALGAVPRGVLHQIDTYFRVPAGRLKLREMETAELIFYRRSNEAGPRSSEYEVAAVAEPERMRTALAAALGVWVTVEKRRELWIYDNVRVHLDEVAGLGSFLELEAVVDAAHPVEVCEATIRRLLDGLGVEADDLVRDSYSDLLGCGGT